METSRVSPRWRAVIFFRVASDPDCCNCTALFTWLSGSMASKSRPGSVHTTKLGSEDCTRICMAGSERVATPAQPLKQWSTRRSKQFASRPELLARNIHVRDGIGEEEFVAMRTARDATLEVPTLILPSLQVNVRAGQLPPADENGVAYLRIPLNALPPCRTCTWASVPLSAR